MPTVCLRSRICVSERGKLYHTNNMFIFYALCMRKKETVSYLTYSMFMIIRKRETVSYLQYVYVLDFMHQEKINCIIPTICLHSVFVYQKEGNCIIPTVCLWSRLCASDREKLYHTYNVYDLDFVYQKKGNCIIPTICLYSIFCVSERGKLHQTYNMFMF